MRYLILTIFFFLSACVTAEQADILTQILIEEMDKGQVEEVVPEKPKPPVVKPKPPEVKPEPKPEPPKKAVTKKPQPMAGKVIEAPCENRPGRANGNRQHFFMCKPKAQYPSFILYYGNKAIVIKNNKPRVNFGNGGLVKQSDTRKGMAILLPSSEPQYDTIYIRYKR